jgi:hypothetical protein
MSSELQEKIARAIWNIRREEEDRCDMDLDDMGRSHSVWREALAAIKAMREPSKGMVDAAYAAHDAYEASPPPKGWGGLSSVFRAMIDHEIKLTEGGRDE